MNFVPAASRRPEPFHAVRFYENAAALGRIVADFLSEGLAQGSPALVLATPENQATIEAGIAARGFEVTQLIRSGELTMVDADETLRGFMRRDLPDAALFRRTITPMLECIAANRGPVPIRAYGEMVDLLWRAGRTVAAVKLEMLWNELARTHDFSLLCGYSMGSFYKSASIDEVCDHHTHIVSATGEYGLIV